MMNTRKISIIVCLATTVISQPVFGMWTLESFADGLKRAANAVPWRDIGDGLGDAARGVGRGVEAAAKGVQHVINAPAEKARKEKEAIQAKKTFYESKIVAADNMIALGRDQWLHNNRFNEDYYHGFTIYDEYEEKYDRRRPAPAEFKVRATIKLTTIEKELADATAKAEKYANQGNEMLAKATGSITDAMTDRLRYEVVDKQKMKDEVAAKGAIDIEKNRATHEATLRFVQDPKNIAKVVAAILTVVGGYYGLKLFFKHLENTMNKPSLVRDSSRKDLREALKNALSSIFYDEEEAASLSGIVLSPEIELKATLLAEDARHNREAGLPYQNALFYGPPGTGKTEFAQLLARYSDMDYAILSGADFSQFKDGEGIVEMHKLFDWANRSKNGLVIFIDEADACFRDRGTLDKDGVNLVNAFLSHTGSSSDKYMIILATNYPDELDAAVRSRIHKKVPFELPSCEDRLKIMQQKFEKYILHDVREYEKDGETIEATLVVDEEVSPAYLQDLATKMNGFSGRDIDQVVQEVRIRAYRSGQNRVTKELVEYVVADKIKTIEADRKTTEEQRRRRAKKAGIDDVPVAPVAAEVATAAA